MNARTVTSGLPVWSLVSALAIGVSAGLMAQPERVSDTVEVRVFNFEVVVTDAFGTPIRGLEAEDFELMIDGRETAIDYFSAVADGRPVSDRAEVSADAELKPFLVIVWDGRELDPGWVRRTLDDLEQRLDELIELTRGVMIVRQGISLETEQAFTANRGPLAAAIARIAERTMTSLETRDRNALIRRMETADAPRGSMSAAEILRVESEAELFLQEIKAQQRLETFALSRSATQLSTLIRALAGLPGRREILYLGRGFKTQAAEPLFELWWRKYSPIARRLGVLSVQSEMGIEGVDRKLLSVIEEANAQQVTFNTFAPGGLRSAGAGIAFSSMEAVEVLDSESDRQRQFILTLARSTGGVSQIQTAEMSPLLTEMLSGFSQFYSLGFQASEGFSGPGRVKVGVRGGHRVRHLDRYRVRRTAPTLEDLTLTALVTDLADNPLQASVDIDQAEPQSDGTFIVPLLVKVPIAKLALLPAGERHVGQVKLVIQAQSTAGDVSEPARADVPIEIDNDELLSAMGRLAGYRLRLRVAAGEQKIAVAVRDEVAKVSSALRLIVDTGDQR